MVWGPRFSCSVKRSPWRFSISTVNDNETDQSLFVFLDHPTSDVGRSTVVVP